LNVWVSGSVHAAIDKIAEVDKEIHVPEERSPENEVVIWGRAGGDGLECTEANPVWIRQVIIGIRVERVYRVCLTTKFESDVNLSVAGYKPYWAETFHGL